MSPLTSGRVQASGGTASLASDLPHRDARYDLAVPPAAHRAAWSYQRKRSGRHGVLAEIQRVVVRMVDEHPTWGHTRIHGALKNQWASCWPLDDRPDSQEARTAGAADLVADVSLRTANLKDATRL